VIDLVEACHRHGQDDASWLRAVAGAATPLLGAGLGTGVFATLIEVPGRGALRLLGLEGDGHGDGSGASAPGLSALHRDIPGGLVRRSWLERRAGLASAHPGAEALLRVLARQLGARDLAFVGGIDAGGLGLWLLAPRRRRGSRDPSALAGLAAMLACAAALRRPAPAGAHPRRTPPSRRLSAREHQVLAHAARDLDNKAIAYGLELSHSTVRVILHRAASKLGVRTRVEAIRRFRALEQL